jgi:serine/threonine protein kinase
MCPTGDIARTRDVRLRCVSEDLTGRRIGHYRIDGVLGRGGMSVMYRATDVRLGRKVALKVMGENLTGDAEFRERFVDEARNTSAIDHANVVPLYDFGEIDGLLYIAMRLVDGADLANLIKDGPLSPARTLALLAQIAEALDMLHDRGLVHLDVKPANVLVTTRESSSEHVYLADFGLTRRGATGHRTRSGDFLGSPTYAAPEHLRGEPVDGRTDEYAMACVLFACLTGRPPFQGQVSDVIAGHLTREPPSVTTLVSLPNSIDQVIRKGMAKEPNGRYPDCRSLVAAARSAMAAIARPGVPAMRATGVQTGPPSGPLPLPQTGPNTGPQAQSQPPPQQLAPQQSPLPPGPGPAGYPVHGQYPTGPGMGQQGMGQPGMGQQGMGQQGMNQQGMGQPGVGQGMGQGWPQGPMGPMGQQGQYGQSGQLGQPGQLGQGGPQSPGEPMRLRPPAPAGASAFTSERSGLSRWGVPILVGLAAVVVIVVLIILFTDGSGGSNSGSGGHSGGGTANSSLPSVRVGSDGDAGQGELPTDFPGQTGP